MMTRWFFIHLMKTGGTSLFFMLQRQFQRKDIFPPPDNADQLSIDSNAAIEEMRNIDSPYHLVSGHYPYSCIEGAPGDWKTLTLLRHPVHRALSSLRRQRDRAGDAPAESIYNDPIRHGMSFDNYMVKVLGATPEDRVGDLFRCEQRHLDRALAALESIDVIGVSEDFAPFVRRLEAAFDWDLGEPLEVNRTAEFDVPDSLVERVWEDNKYDLALYARALDLLGLPPLDERAQPVAAARPAP
jgi:hypothetical protein